MSLFENINFLNEGQQADDYKLRKEAEKDSQEREELQRFERRYGGNVGDKYGYEYLKHKYPSGKRSLTDSLDDQSKSLKDMGRRIDAQSKVYQHCENNPKSTEMREKKAMKNAGISDNEYKRLKKIDDWDYEETDDDIKFADNLANTTRGRKAVMAIGHHQAEDAANRHIRRHPNQYKESGIFESVEFLNDEQIVFEMDLDLLEEEVLNEAIIFKFVKKNDVPRSFKDEALKICKYLEEQTGKKGSEGAGASGIRATFGIRINNASKKIENGKKKNCYILTFSHKDINKAAGVERKVFDTFFVNTKLIQDYMAKALTKLGYKKISEKDGAYWGYYKKKDGYICGVDATCVDGPVNIYIRCLKDCEENKEILAGGKQYL